MKILLVGVNAKFVHSNLAIYTLQEYVKNKGIDVEIAEYTINNYTDEIMADIYRKKPDFVGFSCYIWNITYITEVARELHKVLPKTAIWFGGPEVSYETENYLKEHEYVDGIMVGEGEETFYELLTKYKAYFDDERLCKICGDDNNEDTLKCNNDDAIDGDCNIRDNNKYNNTFIDELKKIEGIVFRDESNNPYNTGMRQYMNMDEIPFVYNDLKRFDNRIIYYESSRGCPYSCSYCMSSIDKRVRYRSLDLVKKELKHFIDNNVSQVKFVDRTFNCNKERTIEIWKFIKENDNGITNFHFEVSADILSDEEIEVIKDMRPRLIQLEIGVQSTNLDTISAIKRKMDFDKLSCIVNKINDTKKVHQHLDLIAGLPYEDYESFKQSFNDVYGLKPEQLQLGFLKVLKGSLMHKQAKEYGIVYKTDPVYEVLQTDWLSYDEVLKLKRVEEVLEVYYNSRQFENTMEYLLRFYESPFHMYESIADYYDKNGLFSVKHSRISRYNILLEMIRTKVMNNMSKECEIARQLLVHDLYLREKIKSRPDFANETANVKEDSKMNETSLVNETAMTNEQYKSRYNEFYKDEESIRSILPGYSKYDTKQIARLTHIEKYDIDIMEFISNNNIVVKECFILYDYLDRNPINYQARIVKVEV